MRRRNLAVGLLVAAATSGAARGQSVMLRDGAREIEVALAGDPRVELPVRDPSDGGKAKTYVGVRLAAVLARLPAPPHADTLAVRCDDGWLSLVPLAAVARFDPILALAEKVGAQTNPLAPPRAPVFLVWPNVKSPAIDREPDLSPGGWTFATASLEYVRKSDTIAASEPPPRASLAAHRGATLFRQHCLHCHAMNGFGGLAAWDLNQPNIVAYRGAARVRAYVLDRRSLNPEGRMPVFRGKLCMRDLDALLAYLASEERR